MQFGLFIAFFLAVLAVVHFIIYEAVVAVFAISSPAWLYALRIIFAFLTVHFMMGVLVSSKFNNRFARILYYPAAVWLGGLVYIFVVACLMSILFGLNPAYEHIQLIGAILFGLAVALTLYGTVRARTTLVKRLTVSLPNLPAGWKGKTAVLISDMHLGHVYGRRFTAKIARLVNNQRPDIVFIAGDLFDGVKVNEADIASPLKQLHTTRGAFYVTGNHEDYGDVAKFKQAVKDAGVTVLTNEKVEVDGLQIVGVEDMDAEKPGELQKILSNAGIDRSRTSILIKHRPTELDIAESHGISMQVSGHTHDAQQWPFTYLATRVYKGYEYGLKAFGAMQVLISSGVGTWGPPLRIGTDSEIVVIYFK